MNVESYLSKINEEIGTIEVFPKTAWGKKITELIHKFKDEFMNEIESVAKIVTNDDIITSYCEDYCMAVKLYTQIMSLSDLSDFEPIEIERRHSIAILATMLTRTMDIIKNCKMNTSKSKFTRTQNKIQKISKRYLGGMDERTVKEYAIELKNLSRDLIHFIKDAYIMECDLSAIECVLITKPKLYKAYNSAISYFDSIKQPKRINAPVQFVTNSVFYARYAQTFQSMIVNSEIKLHDLYFSKDNLVEYELEMENHMELAIAIHQIISIEAINTPATGNQSTTNYKIKMDSAFDFNGVYVLKKMCSILYDIADAACKNMSGTNQKYNDAINYIDAFISFGIDLNNGVDTYLPKLKEHIETVVSTVYAKWHTLVPDYMRVEINKLQMTATDIKRNANVLSNWIQESMSWMNNNRKNGTPFELVLDSADFSVATSRFDILDKNIRNEYVSEKELGDIIKYLGNKFKEILSTFTKYAPEVYSGLIHKKEALEFICAQTKYTGTNAYADLESEPIYMQTSVFESLAQISMVGDICSVISSMMFITNDELMVLKESNVFDNLSKTTRVYSEYGKHIWKKFDTAVNECKRQLEEEEGITKAMKFFGISQ